jgi:hypothetical protein
MWWEGVFTTRVAVPRWTEREIAAVSAAERIEMRRWADWRPEHSPTHVSLRVKASDEAEVRGLVRATLRGLMELDVDAFGPTQYS